MSKHIPSGNPAYKRNSPRPNNSGDVLGRVLPQKGGNNAPMGTGKEVAAPGKKNTAGKDVLPRS